MRRNQLKHLPNEIVSVKPKINEKVYYRKEKFLAMSYHQKQSQTKPLIMLSTLWCFWCSPLKKGGQNYSCYGRHVQPGCWKFLPLLWSLTLLCSENLYFCCVFWEIFFILELVLWLHISEFCHVGFWVSVLEQAPFCKFLLFGSDCFCIWRSISCTFRKYTIEKWNYSRRFVKKIIFGKKYLPSWILESLGLTE